MNSSSGLFCNLMPESPQTTRNIAADLHPPSARGTSEAYKSKMDFDMLGLVSPSSRYVVSAVSLLMILY